MKWKEELRDQFTFESNDDVVFKANCKVHSKHYHTLQSGAKYKGEVLDDAVKYSKDGTTCIHKPNLKRQIYSEAHKVCLCIETGQKDYKELQNYRVQQLGVYNQENTPT